jgi:hypothetical protein
MTRLDQPPLMDIDRLERPKLVPNLFLLLRTLYKYLTLWHPHHQDCPPAPASGLCHRFGHLRPLARQFI